MAELTEFDRAYLQLALNIEKHIPGYVDAYIGPAEIREVVAASDPVPPDLLLEGALGLQATIPQDDPARAAYLEGVLQAMEGTLCLLGGERLTYLEEVAQLYGIQPSLVDEARFEAAHRTLDSLLPGEGNLHQRMEKRRRHYELENERLLPLLEMARRETRQRTEELLDLAPGESMEVELTRDQPWSAYNWYLGNARSLIQFNVDLPVSALTLIDTFAHEGYPGHHTEAQLKEQRFYQEKGYGEAAVALLHSPAAVIAEGIATTAVEIIFPEDSQYQWTVDVLLPAAGLSALETPAEMARIAKAQRDLRYVSGNAAILYHSGQLDREGAIDYLQQYGLGTRERAEKAASFISSPLFRSYIFTYTQGYDLIEQAAGEEKKPLFLRLLQEQWLPSQLATMTGKEDRPSYS